MIKKILILFFLSSLFSCAFQKVIENPDYYFYFDESYPEMSRYEDQYYYTREVDIDDYVILKLKDTKVKKINKSDLKKYQASEFYKDLKWIKELSYAEKDTFFSKIKKSRIFIIEKRNDNLFFIRRVHEIKEID